jgi:two-component system response regulator FixJ
MSDCYMIAIVDDDDAVRLSTAGLLMGAGHKVESFTGGSEFLASDLPGDVDCILLDMRMPGLDGLAVMRALSERDIRLPILVLTGHGDVPMAVEAMRLGAVDFLEKPYPLPALLKAIVRACDTPPADARARALDRQAQARVAALSDRQRDILRGLLKGKPNKIIAWELGLSIRTVETYRAQMLEKLGVRGTAEAVRLAIAAGLGDRATAG